jgi:ribosomal protein S18 acetylase RimI-like enzyme
MFQCIIVQKINNPDSFAKTIYNNFIYLTKYPELSHNIESIKESITMPGTLTLVVKSNDKIIAYLVGDFRELNDKRYVYYISYMYVSEAYQSKGIGTKLMKTLIEQCKNYKVDVILLTCDTVDKNIVKFYTKFGFNKDPFLSSNKRHDQFSLKL